MSVESEAEAGRLDAVYAATSPEEIARTYDAWAEGYEAEMAEVGYRHPTICLALLARHLPAGAGPVLDAGAGTGLIGEWLKIIGHGPVEGVDLSRGMLEVAARKGVYDRLAQGDLTARLPFEDGRFAGAVCAGRLHHRACGGGRAGRAPARAAAGRRAGADREGQVLGGGVRGAGRGAGGRRGGRARGRDAALQLDARRADTGPSRVIVLRRR